MTELPPNLPWGSRTNGICTIDGCDKARTGRGLCRKHYTRWRRHGSPHTTLLNMEPVTWEYLLLHSKPNSETGCIEWQKGISSGYGKIQNNGSHTRVHRVSYELNVGLIPEGKHVLHTCDNRICINPDHLFLGTLLDNIADMVNKERQCRGENCPTSKLTEKDVREIRSEKFWGHGFFSSLARFYGVSPTTIHKVYRHQTWKHVK